MSAARGRLRARIAASLRAQIGGLAPRVRLSSTTGAPARARLRCVTDETNFSLRKIALPAFGPSFLFGLGEGAILPVIALTVRQLGGSVALAALMVTMIGIGSLVSNIPASLITARCGERWAIVGAARVGRAGDGALRPGDELVGVRRRRLHGRHVGRRVRPRAPELSHRGSAVSLSRAGALDARRRNADRPLPRTVRRRRADPCDGDRRRVLGRRRRARARRSGRRAHPRASRAPACRGRRAQRADPARDLAIGRLAATRRSSSPWASVRSS